MKYIIRLDDVCPEMNWEKFNEIKNLLESFDVTAVCGVIPCINSSEFWGKRYEKRFIKEMQRLKDKGWEFAQHGHNHVLSQNGGHLKLNNLGEFPGLNYRDQAWKIYLGKEQMKKWGLHMKYFYAPAHAYDQNTYRAIAGEGFKVVLDGIGLKPWKRKRLLFVPQVLWQGKTLPFNGLTVICLHPHLMEISDVINLENFLFKNKQDVVSVEYAIKKYKYRKRSIRDNIFKIAFYILKALKEELE